MDFGSISGRSTKSSMKRKSLLTAFRKSSQPPPTSYIPPPSTTSSHFPEQPESPYAESTSSQSHSQSQHNDFTPGSSGSMGGRYADSTASSSRTATNASEMQYMPYGRGGAARMRTGSKAVSMRGTLSGSGSAPAGQGRDGSQAASGEKRDRERERERSGGAAVRRPEDMIKVVKDRLFSWSYMMQWYQGETHWFNTVKIPRSTTEAHLGPKALESRARNFFILGISLGLVLDVAGAPEFMKAVIKVLDEWEGMVEGGGKVRGLFKGQKGSRKSGASGTGGEYMGMQDGDSTLLQVNLPFTLDFFQVHSSTCSLIRDIYRKILRFFLPLRAGFKPPLPDPNDLVHPSTIIHSAPIDVSAPPFSRSNSGSVVEYNQATMRSPSTRSTSSASHTPGGFGPGLSSPRPTESDEMGVNMEQAFMQGTPGAPARAEVGGELDYDAFQAYILGELGPDRMLVGDGLPMTKDLVDLFTKVDTRLRKHFSSLLRETDHLARRVLDDELNALMMSLNPGTTPLSFDYNAALSSTGNGFALGRTKSGSRSRPGSAGTTGTGGGYYGMQGGEPVPPLPTGGGSSIYGRE